MSESISACEHCQYKNIPENAQLDYEKQLSLTVTVKVPRDDGPGAIYHVRRDIPQETRETMICDPNPLIQITSEALEQQPCDYIKTGICGLASVVINNAFNQPVK